MRLQLASLLACAPEEIDLTNEFMELGIDSMQAMFLLDELEKSLNCEINPHLFWEYPTVEKFCEQLFIVSQSKSAHS